MAGEHRRHPRASCSRASSSATSAAPSPAPSTKPDSGASARPRAARSSSTRSATCRSTSRPSSCASLQTRRGHAGRRSRKAEHVDVRIVAATNRDLDAEVARRAVPRGSALSPARRSDRTSRRCASARTTSSRSPSTSSGAMPSSSRRQPIAARRRRPRSPRAPTPGPATCASSRTPSSARSCSRPASVLTPRTSTSSSAIRGADARRQSAWSIDEPGPHRGRSRHSRPATRRTSTGKLLERVERPLIEAGPRSHTDGQPDPRRRPARHQPQHPAQEDRRARHRAPAARVSDPGDDCH